MSAATLVANCIFVNFYQIRSLLTKRENVGYQPQNSVVDLRSVYNEFSKKLPTQLRGFAFLPNPTTCYVNRWRTSLMKCTDYFTLYCYRCLLCDSLCSHGVLCVWWGGVRRGLGSGSVWGKQQLGVPLTALVVATELHRQISRHKL